MPSNFAAEGKDEVSDVRVAARLQHDKDQQTDILFTEIDGARYVLRVVGDIFVETGNGTLDSSGVNSDESVLLAIENTQNHYLESAFKLTASLQAKAIN